MWHWAVLLHLTSDQDLQLRHGPYKQHKLCIHYYYISLQRELAQWNKHNSLNLESAGSLSHPDMNPCGRWKVNSDSSKYKYCTNWNITLSDRLLHTQTLSIVSTAVWICYIIHLIMWMAYRQMAHEFRKWQYVLLPCLPTQRKMTLDTWPQSQWEFRTFLLQIKMAYRNSQFLTV
jgi:hypothetical protein